MFHDWINDVCYDCIKVSPEHNIQSIKHLRNTQDLPKAALKVQKT